MSYFSSTELSYFILGDFTGNTNVYVDNRKPFAIDYLDILFSNESIPLITKQLESVTLQVLSNRSSQVITNIN